MSKSQKDLGTDSTTNTGFFRANMLFGKFTATPTVGRYRRLSEWAQNDWEQPAYDAGTLEPVPRHTGGLLPYAQVNTLASKVLLFS